MCAEMLIDGTGSANLATVLPDGSLRVLSSGTNASSQMFEGTIGPATIDKSTFNLNTISQEHHEIHEGDHYYVEGFTTLDSGAVLKVGLTTPNGSKWAHFTWNIGANGVLITRLYEDAGISGGVSITPLNNNRNSPNTSALIISQAVSGTGGTIVSQTSVGGEVFKASIGGVSDRKDELILKSGTDYRREFISSSDDNIISFKASWYEHTDRVQVF